MLASAGGPTRRASSEGRGGGGGRGGPGALALLALAVVWGAGERRARAFDYLEHSYFSDRACRFAQERLGERLRASPTRDRALEARVLALGLVCPARWDRPYCGGGWKRLHGGVHPLSAPGADEVSITLGDLAALPDHISAWGPVRGYAGAAERGLLERFVGWLGADAGDAGGVVGDVSEDACEGADALPWDAIDAALERDLARLGDAGPLPPVAPALTSPLARAPMPRGPRDPAGAYSFDNPHFLDLVLRDTHHFGEHAYAAWAGYHDASRTLAAAACEETLALDADALEALAEGHPEFEREPWAALSEPLRQQRGCALVEHLVAARLRAWVRDADPALVRPVAAAAAEPAAARAVTAALVGLVFEAGGLHFLQDGLSSGHMRAVRRSLGERRYDHDWDNRNGLLAVVETGAGPQTFVAFGDSYVLAPPPAGARVDSTACEGRAGVEASAPGAAPDPAGVSACLVREQRARIVAASAASLLDWALGGAFVSEPGRCAAPGMGAPGMGGASADDRDTRLVCASLPLGPPRSAAFPAFDGLGAAAGNLPVPPPPFEYESLVLNYATDLSGSTNELGVDVAFYRALGDTAGWLTSWRMGVRTVQAADAPDQVSLDVAYGFHWRWAARFLVDAEPFVQAGLRGPRSERRFELALGPRAGITFLPEGWVKIPFELSLTYRLPLVLFTSEHGFFGRSVDLRGHWLNFGLGLAFM